MSPGIVIVLLVVFVATVVLLRLFLVSRQTRRRKRVGAQGDGPKNPALNLIQRACLSWMDVVVHQKAGELLQVTGTAIGGDSFQVIFKIEVTRKYELIYARYAGKVRRSEVGQPSLGDLSSQMSLAIAVDLANTFDIHATALVTDKPETLMGSHPFELVLSNVTSLTTGNAVHMAAKCESLKLGFIRTWDVPSRYSDEALLAQLSATADVAHLAERIRAIQEGARLVSRPGECCAVVQPGVCYVLGDWGGHDMRFQGECDVAILVVESFDSSIMLTDFLKQLTLDPVMHSRIVQRPTGKEQQVESVLLSPDPEKKGHRVSSLDRVNVVLTLRSPSGDPVEVLHIAQEQLTPGFPACIELRYLKSTSFQNVLIWALPTTREAQRDPAV